jgi:hypothetical protein
MLRGRTDLPGADFSLNLEQALVTHSVQRIYVTKNPVGARPNLDN